jgi:transposase
LLRGKDVNEIDELKRQGLSVRAISRITGYCRTTIGKYLKGPKGIPEYAARPHVAGKLEPFKAYLKERLNAGVWNGQVLLRELREHGYDGGYTLLTDWLRPQRQSAQTAAVRRFETPPGRHYGESGVMVRSGAARAFWPEISAAPVLYVT